jgi:transposase
MIYLKTIFLACVYFLYTAFLTTCKHNNTQPRNIADTPISKISYNSSGGRSGNYESLDITPDSIVYVEARRGVEKTITEKTVKNFWSGLIATIKLEDFDKIKSNPGHSLYDGIDVTISIDTGEKKHAIVNGNEDAANYKKILPFANLLEKELAELRKKMTW